MADYHSIIARAVSHLPSTADEARHAIYEQARTALHERLGNDPQISDTDLVNEHFRLEAAIYEVEEDFVTEGYAPVCERRDGLYLKDKGLHTLGSASLVGEAERVPVPGVMRITAHPTLYCFAVIAPLSPAVPLLPLTLGR